MHWAVAVTTCDRQGADYLPATLKSILKAGWIPDYIHHDFMHAGAWPSFLASVRAVRALSPRADAYLIFQDDICVAENARDWIERDFSNGWPSVQPGVVSLYTAQEVHERHANGDGWFVFPENTPCGRMAGALAIILHPVFAKALVDDPPGQNAKNQADIWLCRATKNARRTWVTHIPSLVRHVGQVSAIGTHPWSNWRHEGECWDVCP